MAKRRPSGDCMVRKREDGRWEGRIVIGHKANGDSIFRYIYADTQKELTAKLRQNIDIYQGIDLTEQLMQRIREKKIAAGHKADDHEGQGYIGPAM